VPNKHMNVLSVLSGIYFITSIIVREPWSCDM